MSENTQQTEWQKREIGALWKNEGRSQTYLTGKVGDQKVVIFSNKHKNKDNQPDFRVYKSEQSEGQQAQRQETVATSDDSTETEEELI